MSNVDVKVLVAQFLSELAQQCPNNYYTNSEDKAMGGEEFENPVFKLVPFSYDSFEEDSGDDGWNFVWKDNNYKISWYKHIGRGMKFSRSMSYTEFVKMRDDCIKSLTLPED